VVNVPFAPRLSTTTSPRAPRASRPATTPVAVQNCRPTSASTTAPGRDASRLASAPSATESPMIVTDAPSASGLGVALGVAAAMPSTGDPGDAAAGDGLGSTSRVTTASGVASAAAAGASSSGPGSVVMDPTISLGGEAIGGRDAAVAVGGGADGEASGSA